MYVLDTDTLTLLLLLLGHNRVTEMDWPPINTYHHDVKSSHLGHPEPEGLPKGSGVGD